MDDKSMLINSLIFMKLKDKNPDKLILYPLLIKKFKKNLKDLFHKLKT